ncbi:MAG: hypothetical protein NTU88_00695, partial [Armatimonadetes bacterium]|nr:hypothetical protein [Armatimonadota bacterium]
MAARKKAPKSAEPERIGAQTRTSERTISRMRWYLSALDDFASRGVTVVASHHISEKVGVKPGLIRKDLCTFGDFGRPSKGYNVVYLQKKISYNEMFGQLNRAIRNFAKRQMTWFKRDKGIVWENNYGKIVKKVN